MNIFDGNRITFKPRVEALLELEADYDDFVFSCRHKDILRCSISRHFRSCYAPDGINKHIPFHFCNRREFAIIGKKDKSGDFLWRALVRYISWDVVPTLEIYKFYGNFPSSSNSFYWEEEQKIKAVIKQKLQSSKLNIMFLDWDAWI